MRRRGRCGRRRAVRCGGSTRCSWAGGVWRWRAEFEGVMRAMEGRQLAAAQSQDAGHAQGVEGSGGRFGARRTIGKAGCALGAEAGQPLAGAALGEAEARRRHRAGLVKIDDAMDHLRSTPRGEFGLTGRVPAAVVLGSVLISQPHLPKSSPHEQPIGTSQLGAAANSSVRHSPCFPPPSPPCRFRPRMGCAVLRRR